MMYPLVDIDGEIVLENPARASLQLIQAFPRASIRIVWTDSFVSTAKETVGSREGGEARLRDFLERIGFSDDHLKDVMYASIMGMGLRLRYTSPRLSVLNHATLS